MEALLAELDAVRNDDTVRVVILAAAGKLFSAGHDLKEMTLHRGGCGPGTQLSSNILSGFARA